MNFVCRQSLLHGEAPIPGSKSHTIRAVAIATMASGESVIESPLESADTCAAAHAATALGADVELRPEAWTVHGCGGRPRFRRTRIDVANSGTTLRIVMGLACHAREGRIVLTGDEQIQRRPSGPLAKALNDLGATVICERGNGCPPFTVHGPLQGGHTGIESRTSQYLSSLLLTCPLAPRDSLINVPLLNERPYVQMTLDWLAQQQITVEHDDMKAFRIPGGQSYHAFRRRIPADFSSATFFLGAGALPGNSVACTGLDMSDSQADKAVVNYLREMGAEIHLDGDRVSVRARELEGAELNLNETPDALPVMAVLGCFARGETRLYDVAHARIKETDRIAVMCCELRKMGANIEEREDGLVIRQSQLRGTVVEGHHDHRVVMALALAGLSCDGQTIVTSAESADVTFPDFAALMGRLGGRIEQERP